VTTPTDRLDGAAADTQVFWAVFDNVLDAMLIVNDDGRYVEANAAACRLLGRSREDLLLLEVGGVSPAGMDPIAIWREVLEKGRVTGTWRIQRPDGSTREVEFSTSPFLPHLNLCVMRDVTERDRRTNQLQRLSDAALAIGRAVSVEEISRVATEAAREIIGAHQAVTSFTGENWAQAIHAVSLSDKYAAYRSYAAPPDGSGIYRLVCRTNQPQRLTQAEIEAHAEWRGFGAEAGRHPPMRGWLAVPLLGRDGRNLGLIQLSDKYDGDFEKNDEAILVQLAQLASEAIENARLLEEVRRAHEQMRDLSRRLVHLQEEERRTVARELHDEVAQILASLKFLVEAGDRTVTAPARQHVNEMTRQLLDRLRDMSLDLRPPMLDDLGLVPTLLWHFGRYRALTGIEVRFHHEGVTERLGVGEITAFRIIQEALTNVARHAGVMEAGVHLSAGRGRLEIRVSDQGRGFDPLRLRGASSGLAGMRERALLLGGTFEIESSPGLGTRVRADLPLQDQPP
jgi:PAS domain S-box-containing protein